MGEQDAYVKDQQREYRDFRAAAAGPVSMLPRHYLELPRHLRIGYWARRCDDPRQFPAYCPKQARRTPAIPIHNSSPCLACGHH